MLLDVDWITGYRHLYITECQTDYNKDYWIQQTNLTVNYVDRTVGRSN